MLSATQSWLRLATWPGLSQLFQRLRISLKRARQHVHSPDPDYVAKLRSIRTQVLQVGPTERVSFLFEDEFSFYRQPTLSNTYEQMGKPQPLAELGFKHNSVWRIAALLNAWTGQVVYEQGSQITVSKLLKLYQKALAASPQAESLQIALDNWPVHAHPDLLAALQPQSFPWGLHRPANWPTEPKAKARRMNLPIQLHFLPTYASWTNPIEKLWRLLKQEVLHLHHFMDDWDGLKQTVLVFLNQFANGSNDLLRYVGLSNPNKLYQALS